MGFPWFGDQDYVTTMSMSTSWDLKISVKIPCWNHTSQHLIRDPELHRSDKNDREVRQFLELNCENTFSYHDPKN